MQSASRPVDLDRAPDDGPTDAPPARGRLSRLLRRPDGSGTPGLRADIQGLRAIAVSAVLLYHLWPHRLPGGFAGVDVFFVISGFLITSHILAHPPDRARNLFDFWSRRLRRLLPAALTVLALTLVASRLFAPVTQWEPTAQHVKAAALYVVNWRLASDSVDYLAAAAAPSPVQHFWSLSVEEQFYLFWPVWILLLVLLARAVRKASTRDLTAPIVTAGLVLAVGASLWYSIHETTTDPARAYFVTPTRVWELGLGGLTAAFLSRRAFGRSRTDEGVPLPGAARSVLAWAGLAAIGVTLATYTATTPFPGYQALLPTLGAAAVIAAAAPLSWPSPVPVLSLRPVQWLGDVSYSVYLWHWPLIVLLPAATGHARGPVTNLAIIAASLVLAAASKRYIEDPFRRPGWGRPLVKPFVLAAAAMAVVVAGSLALVTEVHHSARQARTALAAHLRDPGPCFGAAAFGNSAHCQVVTTSGTTYPDALQAAKDMGPAYTAVSHKKDCFSYVPHFREVTCRFGPQDARVRVALVGNSHAGQWVSALSYLAERNHWSVTTYLASQCAFSDVDQNFPTAANTAACRDWVRRTAQRVAAQRYDVVVMTNRISVSAVGSTSAAQSQQRYGEGYRLVLQTLRAAGEPVVAIRDTPAPRKSIPDCLAANPDDFSHCDGTRADWLPAEPLTAVIAGMHDHGIVEADLTRYICQQTRCPAVVGTVPVYFDGSHLTATYSHTLAPYLQPYLERALRV